MIRFTLVFILSVLYSLCVYGQRYSHLNVFEGNDVLDQFHIVVNNTEENEYYVYHDHRYDTLRLNDEFISYSDGKEDWVLLNHADWNFVSTTQKLIPW